MAISLVVEMVLEKTLYTIVEELLENGTGSRRLEREKKDQTLKLLPFPLLSIQNDPSLCIYNKEREKPNTHDKSHSQHHRLFYYFLLFFY